MAWWCYIAWCSPCSTICALPFRLRPWAKWNILKHDYLNDGTTWFSRDDQVLRESKSHATVWGIHFWGQPFHHSRLSPTLKLPNIATFLTDGAPRLSNYPIYLHFPLTGLLNSQTTQYTLGSDVVFFISNVPSRSRMCRACYFVFLKSVVVVVVVVVVYSAPEVRTLRKSTSLTLNIGDIDPCHDKR